MDDGLGPAAVVGQANVFAVVPVAHRRQLQVVRLRVQRQPLLVAPHHHGVVGVLDQLHLGRDGTQNGAVNKTRSLSVSQLWRT